MSRRNGWLPDEEQKEPYYGNGLHARAVRLIRSQRDEVHDYAMADAHINRMTNVELLDLLGMLLDEEE